MGRLRNSRKIPSKDLFVENSTSCTSTVKKRIIAEKLLPYECAICGRGPVWKGKELVFVLDHINGVNNDHRLENLRFLCPNCNTQTETFAMRKYSPKKHYKCSECGTEITRYSKTGLCAPCFSKSSRKAERPPREELEELIEEYGYCAVGRMFGVSNNAIKKWLHNL